MKRNVLFSTKIAIRTITTPASAVASDRIRSVFSSIHSKRRSAEDQIDTLIQLAQFQVNSPVASKAEDDARALKKMEMESGDSFIWKEAA